MTEFVDHLLDLAVQIQQIPAPSFGEKLRARFVKEQFIRENLLDVYMDPDNNVFSRLPGRTTVRPLIVSAHLDTVFSNSTSLQVMREKERIYGPGIGDNSLGVAALFGLLRLIREREMKLEQDIWFIANTCEEGLGDLRGMKAVVDQFGEGVEAYLVLEGMALGHIYHRAVGVRRYRVTARTAGGHSWSDYGQPSAVHELASLVSQITEFPLTVNPRTTLNVGLISGGTGVNVLASEAKFELDVRSESTEALNTLAQKIEDRIWIAKKDGVEIELQVIGLRPAGEIAADHPLAKLAEECLSEQGIKAVFTSGSTDANVPLSRGYPAIVLGITTGGSAHTVHEYIDTAPVEKGMEQLVKFVEKLFCQK